MKKTAQELVSQPHRTKSFKLLLCKHSNNTTQNEKCGYLVFILEKFDAERVKSVSGIVNYRCPAAQEIQFLF